MPAGRTWTNREAEKAREMREQGISWRKIGRALGRSEGSVSGFLHYNHKPVRVRQEQVS